MRCTALTLSAILLSSCAAEGSVEISFLLPDGELSPIGASLAEITIITKAPGESAPRSQTVQVPDGANEIPGAPVPVSDGVEIQVELRSAPQRLIGYGRSDGPVTVSADSTTVVPIRVRRPFVYVTGAPVVYAYDAALDQTAPYATSLTTSGTVPYLVTATRDGGELLAIAPATSGAELRVISTADHRERPEIALPLSAEATALALSPDDRYLVTGHGGDTGGLSMVATAALSQEMPLPTFVALGNVSEVVVSSRDGTTIAYALLDGARAPNCAEPIANSTVIGVEVETGAVTTTIQCGTPVSDLAIDTATGTLLLAAPCRNQVMATDPLDQPPALRDLRYARAVTAVAVQDERVWSVGALPPTEDRSAVLEVRTARLDGSGETRVELPQFEERALAKDLSGSTGGQNAEIRITADAVTALDMAVVPGGNHVALLVQGYYHSEQMTLRDPLLGELLIVPAITLTTSEYLLVDMSSALLAQRVRTQCTIQRDSSAYLKEFECTRAVGQDVAPVEFQPRRVSALYGER